MKFLFQSTGNSINSIVCLPVLFSYYVFETQCMFYIYGTVQIRVAPFRCPKGSGYHMGQFHSRAQQSAGNIVGTQESTYEWTRGLEEPPSYITSYGPGASEEWKQARRMAATPTVIQLINCLPPGLQSNAAAVPRQGAGPVHPGPRSLPCSALPLTYYRCPVSVLRERSPR